MTTRKNYNSIVFLTTLSVYLGLVLVGAPASVLAQAALTSKLEVKDRIEKKDDLDKKPDGYDGLEEEVELVQNLKIAEALSNFVADLNKLESIGKFNRAKDGIFLHKIWLEEYDSTMSASSNSNIENVWLQTAVKQLISNTEPQYLSSISNYLPNCKGKTCRESSVFVESSANEFSLTFIFTKSTAETAKIAAETFGKIFLQQKIALRNRKNLAVYENTKVTSENNQVFIVTRLPRGSLDALIAKDAQ